MTTTPAQHQANILGLVLRDAFKLANEVEKVLKGRPGPDGWHWVSVQGIDVAAWFRVRDEYTAAGWEVTVDALGMKLRPARQTEGER